MVHSTLPMHNKWLALFVVALSLRITAWCGKQCTFLLPTCSLSVTNYTMPLSIWSWIMASYSCKSFGSCCRRCSKPCSCFKVNQSHSYEARGHEISSKVMTLHISHLQLDATLKFRCPEIPTPRLIDHSVWFSSSVSQESSSTLKVWVATKFSEGCSRIIVWIEYAGQERPNPALCE